MYVMFNTDKIPIVCEGVYKITCSRGESYTGQTKRNIRMRLKEPIRATKYQPIDIYFIHRSSVSHSFIMKRKNDFEKLTSYIEKQCTNITLQLL